MLTSVFETLGRQIAHHPRRTVGVWVVLTALGFALAVFGLHGENLFDRLTTGNPGVPGAQSSQGEEILAGATNRAASLSLVVSGVPPQTPGVAEALEPARADLAAIPGVVAVIDPFALPEGIENPAAAPLLAQDGDGFLVVVELDPALAPDEREAALAAVHAGLAAVPAQLHGVAPGATGLVGGTSLIYDAITSQVEKDLTTGEAIALPVALAIMVLVFGGFLAAAMPMVGAIASIGAGLGALLGFSYLLDLDSSVVNVVTLLGLGLSIDYGLLIVSRFREELGRVVEESESGRARRRRGDSAVTTALVRTMATAGRTVAFSALTVAIAIAGLLVFRPNILRAFGAAGVAIVLIAVATAMTLVPAMLVIVGRRIGRPGPLSRVPGLRRLFARTANVSSEEGFFSSLASRVQRHPWWVMIGSLALLGLLASPLASIELRNSTTQLLPLGSTQRAYVQAIAENYPAASTPAVTIVAEASLEEATAWAAQLDSLPDVASVDPPTPSGAYVVIGVRPTSADAGGVVAQEVVREVRALEAPFPLWVTGQAASQVDFTHALAERAPWAIGIVVAATFVLLFLMTGSVLIPVQALLTNAISLAASLGVLVWAFQSGHLSGLLGFVSVGGIETYVVALVIAFAFGLAMDYEVFLLSRVKELHDAGLPTNDALRLGLQRSGRIITSAALIIIVVFAGFVAGKLLVIKEVGFALAVAVLIDATIVRMLLVPAVMTILGPANWWAPPFLRRVYARLALTH